MLKVGKIIRKLRIEETPQLLNILKGDMSIVGPRPQFVKDDLIYAQVYKHFLKRNKTFPGLTGWAQINGYRGKRPSNENMKKAIVSNRIFMNRDPELHEFLLKELTYILDNIINLEDTLNNFAGIMNENHYLTLSYKNEEDENDNNIYKLEFKKCKKIVKMYKKTNDIYDNNGKTIYRFKTFPKGEPPRKLESLLCNTISTNKFSITGDMDAGWFVGMKLYKKRDLYDDYHLYEE